MLYEMDGNTDMNMISFVLKKHKVHQCDIGVIDAV